MTDDRICLCPSRESCPGPGKHPTTPRGHLDASAEAAGIARLFERWPGDNLALATGKGSGVVVLDEDTFGGASAVAILEREYGPLPATLMHHSGGGGLHRFYGYPKGVERVPTGVIWPPGTSPKQRGDSSALELLGDGGKAILPPSRHAGGGRYEVLLDLPVAPCPPWLVGLASGSRLVAVEGEGDRRGRESRYTLPDAIPDGARDEELTAYGGSLRACGWEHGAILARLREVNAGRCVPPMEDARVQKIARSVSRYEKGSAGPVVTPEVLAELGAIQGAVLDAAWPGVGGKSERSVMVALVLAARGHGTLIPAGVRVGIDTRTLAVSAGMPHRTLMRATQRLRHRGLIRRDDLHRRPADAGAFVLVSEAIAGFASLGRARRAQCHHSTTSPSHTPSVGEWKSGDGLRAPRLRHGFSFGKTDEVAVDALEAVGGRMGLEDLAAAVGVKRVRDFRQRTVKRLEAAKVVEVEGDRVSLREGWLEAIDRERTLSGEKRAENLDRAEHERQREAYRMWTAEQRTTKEGEG